MTIADEIRNRVHEAPKAGDTSGSIITRQNLQSTREEAEEDMDYILADYLASFNSSAGQKPIVEDMIDTDALEEEPYQDAIIREAEKRFKEPEGTGWEEFVKVIDKVEGGADYDTLFGHSQRAGGHFDGFKVSEMTLAELEEFQKVDGEYAQWVKHTNPKKVLATPAGRFQFVGKTLQATAKEMGLSKDTVFNADTQNAMALFKLKQRLKRGKTLKAKRANLRAEWDGFRHVSNKTLDYIINNIGDE